MFSGERLRAIRLVNEMTQENLGKLVGVGKVTISKWESETTVPNAKHLRALEETFWLLKVTLSRILSSCQSTIN